MNTEYMLLGLFNKPRLTFEEVCRCLNLELSSGRTKRAQGKFPIPINGSPLGADIRDVSKYLDELRGASNLHQNTL